MKIFLATKNPGKISEFREILSGLSIDLMTCNDLEIPDVEETGSTFVENAILKARSATETTKLPSIADDSGIEVDFLKGRPGVWSARYAGTDASNEENNLKLLTELQGVAKSERSACYRCVIVFMRFHNDPFPFIAQDTWRGSILEHQKGSNGFGYDPIFYLPDKGMTAAELDSTEKHKISHRKKALKKFNDFFTTYVQNN